MKFEDQLARDLCERYAGDPSVTALRASVIARASITTFRAGLIAYTSTGDGASRASIRDTLEEAFDILRQLCAT